MCLVHQHRQCIVNFGQIVDQFISIERLEADNRKVRDKMGVVVLEVLRILVSVWYHLEYYEVPGCVASREWAMTTTRRYTKTCHWHRRHKVS